MPGPMAIRYYLEQDPTLQAEHLPRSPRTIAKILHQQHLIAKPRERKHQQMAVPPPGTQWDIDDKDATTVAHSANPSKRQHHVEILNVLDPATAQVLASEARPDYTMATTLEMLVSLMERLGVPRSVRCDRDHRFVGQGNRDVPTPILRMFACLGVEVVLCPPRRPDKNGFIERFHLSQKEECLLYDRPHTLEEVQASVSAYRQHYNAERPHQSPRCRNRPPDVAFPEVPARSSLPDMVDPDGWITAWDGRMYVRKVGRNGAVTLDDERYWPGKAYAGQYVLLRIEAATRSFVIEDATKVIRTVPIRTVGGGLQSRQVWVAQLVDDAKREDAKRRKQRDQDQKDLTP